MELDLVADWRHRANELVGGRPAVDQCHVDDGGLRSGRRRSRPCVGYGDLAVGLRERVRRDARSEDQRDGEGRAF
jgi:hypothetical protein